MSMFLSSSYTLCRIKALRKKLSFGLVKKKHLFKSEKKNEMNFFYCYNVNMSHF
jgi:hypothetical protein